MLFTTAIYRRSRKAMLYDKGKTVVEKKTRKVPKMQRAANGQFVSKKEGQVRSFN